MPKIITASDMDFIADNTFYIEESDIYKKLKDGIKTVEFVRAKEDKLFFVEAKMSFPAPENPKPDNPDNFDKQVADIWNKFIHSLNLYASIAIGVNEQLPIDFKPAYKVSLNFILVINNFEIEWCKPIKNALDNKLSESGYIKQIWKPTVYVINHEDAKKYNLCE